MHKEQKTKVLLEWLVKLSKNESYCVLWSRPNVYLGVVLSSCAPGRTAFLHGLENGTRTNRIQKNVKVMKISKNDMYLGESKYLAWK